MGYSTYDTPLGPAGYAVEDTCHLEGCSETIDRGLAYLCGSSPGCEDEFGCGRWFCASHLYGGPEDQPGITGLCGSCRDAYEQAEA